jgi:hypothetical protein
MTRRSTEASKRTITARMRRDRLVTPEETPAGLLFKQLEPSVGVVEKRRRSSSSRVSDDKRRYQSLKTKIEAGRRSIAEGRAVVLEDIPGVSAVHELRHT